MAATPATITVLMVLAVMTTMTPIDPVLSLVETVLVPFLLCHHQVRLPIVFFLQLILLVCVDVAPLIVLPSYVLGEYCLLAFVVVLVLLVRCEELCVTLQKRQSIIGLVGGELRK